MCVVIVASWPYASKRSRLTNAIRLFKHEAACPCTVPTGRVWRADRAQKSHLRSDAAAAQAGKSEEAGVVPAADKPIGDQAVELALGQHVVRDTQPRVLPHHRLVCVQYLPHNACPPVTGFAKSNHNASPAGKPAHGKRNSEWRSQPPSMTHTHPWLMVDGWMDDLTLKPDQIKGDASRADQEECREGVGEA